MKLQNTFILSSIIELLQPEKKLYDTFFMDGESLLFGKLIEINKIPG